MDCFNSWPRKLAMIPLSLFLVGWIVYLAGFSWLLATWTGVLYYQENEDSISLTDQQLHPFYISMILGLVIFLGGVLHATVPQLPGLICAIFLASGSTIHFAVSGAVAYKSALNVSMTLLQDRDNIFVRAIVGVDWISFKNGSTSIPIHPDYLESLESSVSPAVILMLMGSLIQVPSWLLVTICSVFYKYKLKRRSERQSSREEEEEEGQRRCSQQSFFSGPARKLNIPFIVISAIGWCILVSSLNFNVFTLDYLLFIAPLLYIAALMHAGFSGALSTVMEVCTCVLSMIYVPLIGATFSSRGQDNYRCHELDWFDCDDEDHRGVVKIAGGIISLIFWAGVPSLWPFYRDRLSSKCSRNSERFRGYITNDDDQPLMENNL